MIRRWSLSLIAVTAACLGAQAQTLPHPGDLIREPGYRESWSALIKGERFVRRDSWIAKLIGPGSAARFRDPSGVEWIEGNVCQPHNCGDNHLIVFLNPGTKRIFAAQRTRGDLPPSQRFFGAPDSAMKKLLSDRIAVNFP